MLLSRHLSRHWNIRYSPSSYLGYKGCCVYLCLRGEAVFCFQCSCLSALGSRLSQRMLGDIPTSPFEHSDINGFIVFSGSWHRSLLPCFFLTSRGPEAKKQMGLCHPRDPLTAHHHHHHRDTALGCVCDHHGQWNQDHGHLGSGHNPEEGKAVTPSWAGVSCCRPVPLVNVNKVKDGKRGPVNCLWKKHTNAPRPMFSWTVIRRLHRLVSLGLYLHWHVTKPEITAVVCEWKTRVQMVLCWNLSVIIFLLICWQQLFKIYKNKIV